MGQETIIDNSKNDEPKDYQSSIKNHPMFKREYVRDKMEAMQKRIDELKEKVKTEGEQLHKEGVLETEILVQKLADSSNSFQYNSDESESERSLYFSASTDSTCSLNTSSNSTFNNFTKFVNNLVKTQNPKERLSLLQLHSKKQIALNMMRHSLTQLDSMCSEELELIKRNLQHLKKLAEEFDVNVGNGDESRETKALEFHYGQSEKVLDRNWHCVEKYVRVSNVVSVDINE